MPFSSPRIPVPSQSVDRKIDALSFFVKDKGTQKANVLPTYKVYNAPLNYTLK